MPVYEYRCRACEHQFDIQQSINDDPLTVCPECAGALRKVFAPVGIAFKGSGFYKNDARSSSGSASRSGTSGSDGATSSGSGESSSSGSGSTSGSGSETGTGSGGSSGSNGSGSDSSNAPATSGSSTGGSKD